jgi:predicted transcriptional regulator
MLTKEKVDKTIRNLPDSFSLDELVEKLIFIEKIEEGYQQSENGKVVTNEEVKLAIDSARKMSENTI